jgi:hypothetical protein
LLYAHSAYKGAELPSQLRIINMLFTSQGDYGGYLEAKKKKPG